MWGGRHQCGLHQQSSVVQDQWDNSDYEHKRFPSWPSQEVVCRWERIINWFVRFQLSPFSVSWEWEIVDWFFKQNNIRPFWINIKDLNNQGKLNPETGKWDGFFGKVGYGEADLGLRGSYRCDFEMSKVVLCSPGISYHIPYWWVEH